MAVKSKKEKITAARKNAEALKAQKKAQRDARAKQDYNAVGAGKKGGQKKGPSLIKQVSKKRK